MGDSEGQVTEGVRPRAVEANAELWFPPSYYCIYQKMMTSSVSCVMKSGNIRGAIRVLEARKELP